MVEILFLCGSGKNAVVAFLGGLSLDVDGGCEADKNEVKLFVIIILADAICYRFYVLNRFARWLPGHFQGFRRSFN